MCNIESMMIRVFSCIQKEIEEENKEKKNHLIALGYSRDVRYISSTANFNVATKIVVATNRKKTTPKKQWQRKRENNYTLNVHIHIVSEVTLS